eukprot:2278307-Amphidinium_carterae.1
MPSVWDFLLIALAAASISCAQWVPSVLETHPRTEDFTDTHTSNAMNCCLAIHSGPKRQNPNELITPKGAFGVGIPSSKMLNRIAVES